MIIHTIGSVQHGQLGKNVKRLRQSLYDSWMTHSPWLPITHTRKNTHRCVCAWTRTSLNTLKEYMYVFIPHAHTHTISLLSEFWPHVIPSLHLISGLRLSVFLLNLTSLQLTFQRPPSRTRLSYEGLLSQRSDVFYSFLSLWVVWRHYSNSICVSAEGMLCGWL